MSQSVFSGVLPAVTTPFNDDLTIDHAFLERHCKWLLDNRCQGIVALGSLGEGATLRFDEKVELLSTCVKAVGDRGPVIAAISALSTREATELAQRAKDVGCKGLMVLPPYVHKGPWEEIKAHFEAILEATDLPCMLYNNPIAYGTDILPEQVAELKASHANVAAVKESSGDVRRVTAVRALLGNDINVLAGLDDMVVEAASMGADGWVAGLVNALPEPSVRVFELARDGKREEAFELYRWFLPLLRMDTVPEFVQLIKLVQAHVDMGSETVRPPRAKAAGLQREQALATIRERLAPGAMPQPK